MAMKEKSKIKKSFNDYAIIELQKTNIKYESLFNNSYIIIQGLRGGIDFYPGTGAFHCKSTGICGRGIKNAIMYAKSGVPPF